VLTPWNNAIKAALPVDSLAAHVRFEQIERRDARATDGARLRWRAPPPPLG